MSLEVMSRDQCDAARFSIHHDSFGGICRRTFYLF